MSIKMSGLVCDKCKVIIKYASAITEEDKETDFHLCERCNPRPEPIVTDEDAIVEAKSKRANKKRK